MKVAFLIFNVLSCITVSAQYQFSINGTVPSEFNGKKVYITIEDNYSRQKYRMMDSATVENNNFSFAGSISKLSEKATLQTKDKGISGFFYFVVDSGLNTMQVNPLPPKWPLFKNKLSNTEIINSPSNKIKKSFDSLTNRYFLTKGKPSKENKYVLELDSTNRKQLRREQVGVLKQYPDNFYTLIHLYSEMKTAGSFRIAEAREVFDVLNSQLQSSILGTEVREIIAASRSTELGNTVSYFTTTTNKGSSFSNISLNGTVYLLAFGATWCGPCKERLPMLAKLYDRYNSNGFQIVYINLDEKTELWKRQIAKYRMQNWINVSEGVKLDASEVVRRFNVSAIPYYLLVNKEGKIAYNPFQMNDFEYKDLEKTIKASLH